jgi:hypothetical protein
VYATVADLRAEGVSTAAAADDRLTSLLAEACPVIDRVTGWFFEPRPATFYLDGRGSRSIEPPVPAIRLDRLVIHGGHRPFAIHGRTVPFDLLGAVPVAPEDIRIVGAPVVEPFEGPSIHLVHWHRFPPGIGNIEVSGLWGYTEADGSPTGRTPLSIRRAAMLLVLRQIPKLAGSESADARNRWRLIEERTRDQSYRLAPLDAAGALTGDPEVDQLLYPYRRPFGLGAA